LALAKALNARVTAVTVTEPWSSVLSGELTGGLGVTYSFEAHEKICAARAKQALEAATKLAQEIGIGCETVHVKDQFPSEGIIGTATARGCDLIVMATHGRRGFSRLVVGSEANRVVIQSTVPVLIYR
jgi:nucleotide-binding universal stress UspA family protein